MTPKAEVEKKIQDWSEALLLGPVFKWWSEYQTKLSPIIQMSLEYTYIWRLDIAKVDQRI